MNTYSVTMTEELHQQLFLHLVRKDGQEDLCFATYIPSSSSNRFTGIITHPIFPLDNERKVHGNVEFFSSYLLRALKIANDRKEGLAFLHSHPFQGWQAMSAPDIIAEKRISPLAFASTDLPLLGLTLGTDGSWSARFWLKEREKRRVYKRKWCSSVRIIGNKLSITFNNNLKKPQTDLLKQTRTISSWGQKTQDDITRLKIGIIGLGSVGSIVAENLARTGITDLVLIDFDTVENKNLDRTLGVDKSQVGMAKVRAIAKSLRRSSSSKKISIECVEYSICEEEGFKAALDCDLLFSCVDKPWPRQVLNFISYAHLIPVIDGGIRVRTNSANTKLLGASWRAHTVGYKRTCLECIGQYRGDLAKVESEGFLDDPIYIEGMSDKHTVTASENVFAFSSHLAAMEVLQFVSLFVSPGGESILGQQMYHLSAGKLDNEHTECHSNCFYQTIIGTGDKTEIKLYGKHEVAEKIRNERNKKFKKVS